MPGPMQVSSIDPVVVAAVLGAVAVVLLVVVVVRLLRGDGDTAVPADDPMTADAPRGRICPACSAVNELDADECASCGRSFGDPAAAEA